MRLLLSVLVNETFIAYNFNQNEELPFGLIQVSFGITKYNSSSWFFSLNYCVDIEDEHDMAADKTQPCLGQEWIDALATGAPDTA